MGIILNYTKPESTNVYADDAAEFVKIAAENPGAAYELVVPTDDGTRGGKALNAKARFQSAVRAAGATARVANVTEADGNTHYVFTLSPLRAYAPRNRAVTVGE